MSEFFPPEEDHKWRILLQTSKGRKRKLSCFKSKQRKKEEKVKNKFFPPNYVRITYSSSSEDDEQLDVEEMSATKIDSSNDIEESIFSSEPDLDGYEEELEESGNDEKNMMHVHQRINLWRVVPKNLGNLISWISYSASYKG